MPIFLYIAPKLELLFAFLGWWVLLFYCWKKGWVLGNEKMSSLSGMIYSLGTGALFGLLIMGILIGHFGLL